LVLLLVGDGSYAPLLDVPPGKFSFYYLELALEARLQKKGQLYSGENLYVFWRGTCIREIRG
jgi:hypothetical protein